MSRRRASDAELLKFDGAPCRHGHGTLRYLSSGYCVECTRLSGKRRHWRTPAHLHVQRAYLQAKIVNCLRAAEGGLVSTSELIEYCYGTALIEVPDVSIRLAIRILRSRGWPIATVWGRGYRYAPENWRPLEEERIAA